MQNSLTIDELGLQEELLQHFCYPGAVMASSPEPPPKAADLSSRKMVSSYSRAIPSPTPGGIRQEKVMPMIPTLWGKVMYI